MPLLAFGCVEVNTNGLRQAKIQISIFNNLNDFLYIANNETGMPVLESYVKSQRCCGCSVCLVIGCAP